MGIFNKDFKTYCYSFPTHLTSSVMTDHDVLTLWMLPLHNQSQRTKANGRTGRIGRPYFLHDARLHSADNRTYPLYSWHRLLLKVGRTLVRVINIHLKIKAKKYQDSLRIAFRILQSYHDESVYSVHISDCANDSAEARPCTTTAKTYCVDFSPCFDDCAFRAKLFNLDLLTLLDIISTPRSV